MQAEIHFLIAPVAGVFDLWKRFCVIRSWPDTTPGHAVERSDIRCFLSVSSPSPAPVTALPSSRIGPYALEFH